MPKEKILVIDENENTRELLKNVFASDGYEVILAASGVEALDKAKDELPNFLILDIILPDIDGYQLLEFIKQESQLRFIPIIILTSRRELEDKLRGLRLGVIDYITKPFQRDELRAKVRNILDLFKWKFQIRNESNSQNPRERLLKYLEEKSVTQLIPVVRKEAKLGYEYPEVAKVLEPEEVGGEIFTLERLAKEKHLDRVFYDLIHICPSCGYHDLNFREICPYCESAEIIFIDVLIHIKCGHKAFEYEFNHNGKKICPACKKSLSGEGIDYEKANRPVYQCLSCRKKFSESVVNCRCLNCDSIFDVGKALKRKIYSYHLRKLKDQSAEDLDVLEDHCNQTPEPNSSAEGETDTALLQPLINAFNEAGLEALNWPFFSKQLRLEIKRCQKNNYNLTLLKLTLLQQDGVDFDSGVAPPEDVVRKMAIILKKCLRELDVISIKNSTEYIVLLPETPLSMAKILGVRIQEYMDQLKIPATVEVSLSGYPEDGKEAEELLEVLNLNLAILKPDNSQEDFNLI